MRTVGLLLIGLGAASLMLLAGFMLWAHYMYAVGSLPFMLRVRPALPGLAIMIVGALLVWRAQRRAILR